MFPSDKRRQTGSTTANLPLSTVRTEKLDGIERRDKVVLELIETEESYIHNLQLLIKGFIVPLRNSKVRGVHK